MKLNMRSVRLVIPIRIERYKREERERVNCRCTVNESSKWVGKKNCRDSKCKNVYGKKWNRSKLCYERCCIKAIFAFQSIFDTLSLSIKFVANFLYKITDFMLFVASNFCYHILYWFCTAANVAFMYTEVIFILSI